MPEVTVYQTPIKGINKKSEAVWVLAIECEKGFQPSFLVQAIDIYTPPMWAEKGSIRLILPKET